MFVDDAQVARLVGEKRYAESGENEGTLVRVTVLEDNAEEENEQCCRAVKCLTAGSETEGV